MTDLGAPVSGRDSRISWVVEQLDRFLASSSGQATEVAELVAWYMSYGISLGATRDELLAALRSRPELASVAEALTEEEIERGKPPPEFRIGDSIEVVLNGRNYTYHKGKICDAGWDHVQRLWLYSIESNGKRISHRYEARDLRAVGG